MLTGEAPSEYPLPDARSRVGSIGEGFASVIIPKCAQLDREMRYQDCEELVADLEVYEELTQEYFDSQKSKIKKFTRTCSAGIVLCVISLILFITGNIMLTQNYLSQLRIAENSDTETAINAFIEAINYKPGEKEPYLGLEKLYAEKVDGTSDLPVLKTDKFNHIHELLEKHNSDLRSSGNFDDVYYELGKAV